MSEPMFPTSDGGVAAPAPSPVVEAKGNRTALLALGGVLAAVVVGGGSFYLMNSGSSGDPAPTAAAPVAQSAAPAASPSPAATKPAVIRPASVSVTGRDPFKPLYAVAVPGTVTGGSPTTAPAPNPSVAPVTPATTPVTPSVTLAVSKINTVKQTATVTVDGKPYAASVGAPFATNFVMYSVFNSQCVGILFGDQSVPVCTNAPQTVSP